MVNDVPPASSESVVRIDYLGFLKRRWTPLDFLRLALLLGTGATLVYFFRVIHIYEGIPITTWAWARYEPQYNFEHGRLVPWIFAFLVWHHKDEIAKAKKEGSNIGLIWVIVGCLIFAAGARTLQGRVGMAAGPVILYGIVLYLWGKEVARIMFFPILFLAFMIPLAAIEQATFKLQFIVTGMAKAFCGMVGMPLLQDGTTLRPADLSFKGFEVAEGCSGIRSLMAMVMVTAIFVHLTQNKLWKKLTIFFCSIGFAIIGNVGRIISIFIVAKYFGATFAGGPYHEYSGYISFPIALGAMLLLSSLLDLPIFEAAKAIKTGKVEPGSGLAALTKKDEATYDY
jgi:exosortase